MRRLNVGLNANGLGGFWSMCHGGRDEACAMRCSHVRMNRVERRAWCYVTQYIVQVQSGGGGGGAPHQQMD